MRVVGIAQETDATKAPGGYLLDGWPVEVFAVDVPANEWPASDAVALCFGPTAQGKRFHLEDREEALGRIVGYHLSGQELASLAGLVLSDAAGLRVALDSPSE